jgi:hypothetical protein
MTRPFRLLAAVLLLAGCAHAPTEAPGKTVRRFYAALYARNANAALQQCSKQMRDFAGDDALLANFTALSANLEEDAADVQIVKERVEKDYAMVWYQAPSPASGRDSLQLIREGGVWRLALGRPK